MKLVNKFEKEHFNSISFDYELFSKLPASAKVDLVPKELLD